MTAPVIPRDLLAAVQDLSKPIGIATYRPLRSIPEPYKSLPPVIDGVKRVLKQSLLPSVKGT